MNKQNEPPRRTCRGGSLLTLVSAEDQNPASVSLATIASTRGTWSRGLREPHLHFRVGIHVLQLEPRVPVVVLLQVLFLNGHLSWKTNAEETSHEGPICPPDLPCRQDLHSQRQSSQTETQNSASGDGQCGRVTEATFCLGSATSTQTQPVTAMTSTA